MKSLIETGVSWSDFKTNATSPSPPSKGVYTSFFSLNREEMHIKTPPLKEVGDVNRRFGSWNNI